MIEEEKIELANKTFTFLGHRCNVAGYKNFDATITSDFPGFWSASFETVKIVSERDSDFTDNDVRLSSWRWLGIGVDLPEELVKYV